MASSVRNVFYKQLFTIKSMGSSSLPKQIPRLYSSEAPKAEIYKRWPSRVKVTQGKTYAWCACGRSQKQPFCDGAHKYDKVTGEKMASPYPIEPLKYTADKDKAYQFCNCKQTSNKPFCDGTHMWLFITGQK
ncbi:CDGSH iron-sulfur domain-containing protein 3, mitochondrial-like [Watersipora subatra]|uniref:CDGSH iron-sulfur domain-containing protein 3, mitochondrial-like n=1 Tax=Watersipora subatra TaxID=2589382 RepID=UPI00355BE3C3